MAAPDTPDIERLEKRLGLLDVYAICTGAMFASGFFLLPGIAAANAGPGVVLAYLISSILMIPGMLSIAELSSAMPRAAGTYFFIHRSLGPLAGTIGGFGDWLVLTFKSAFALVGLGAYLTLYLDVPMRPVAVALTVAFGALNILGAKETARLQVWLVAVLLAIMAFFVAAGLLEVVGQPAGAVSSRLSPLLPFGFTGLASTVGLVFISYAGLTKVAAAAEEIDQLDRNLPLGMLLALLTIAVIYVGGVYILVALLDLSDLAGDLTPIASAGELVFHWVPGTFGLLLVVVAAIMAFASTGNAGILTASRYPLAMARDQLTWSGFERIGRFGTPTISIVATCGLMIAAILFLDVERLASLGSAFLLLMFTLVNLSVIIMRESRITSYAPGFHSPWYPWTQIVGIVSTGGLLATLGPFYVAFVLVIVTAATLWYRFYARGKVSHRGAIYSLFLRLGQQHDQGIDQELWGILRERGASEDDSFDALIARAEVIDIKGGPSLDEVIARVRDVLAERLPASTQDLESRLQLTCARGVLPDTGAAVVYDLLLPALDRPEMVLVRASRGVVIDGGSRFPGQTQDGGHGAEGEGRVRVSALLFLVGGENRMTRHLRLLAQLVSMTEAPAFVTAWRKAADEQALAETLMRDERFASIVVGSPGPPADMADRRLRELTFPGDTLVALVTRGSRTIVPHGDTMLRAGDRLTVIGSPEHVAALMGQEDDTA